MPSAAVVAKNSLVTHLLGLVARLDANQNALSALPDSDEWGRITELAREALRLKNQSVEKEFCLRWVEIARLEKVYRPGLKFSQWFERFVEVLELKGDPVSLLQKEHWDELKRQRIQKWNKRDLKYQVIDWFINEFIPFRAFDVRHGFNQPFPSFDNLPTTEAYQLKQTNTFWIELGKVLATQMKLSLTTVGLGAVVNELQAARAGYEVCLRFLENYRVWLRQPANTVLKRDWAAHNLRELQNLVFEERLIKLRYAFLGASGYRQQANPNADLFSNGQVTTLRGAKEVVARRKEASRKRTVTGGKTRKLKKTTPARLISLRSSVKVEPATHGQPSG